MSHLDVIEGLLESQSKTASPTINYGNLALYFTAWKKGCYIERNPYLPVEEQWRQHPAGSGHDGRRVENDCGAIAGQ